MKAADIMTRDVVTVTPTTAVAEIVKLLIEKRISAVPVVGDAGRLVGVVSEADLLHRPETGTEFRRPWWLDLFADPDGRAEAFLKAHGRTAGEVMTRDVEIVAPDTPLDVVARLMEERRVRRLPVVDAEQKVVGIVARADLIRVLAEPAGEAAQARGDRAIRERFEGTIRSAGFGSAGLVRMVVEDGEVELWGVAETDTERRALELAAAEIPGVRRVENHLAVRKAFAAGV